MPTTAPASVRSSPVRPPPSGRSATVTKAIESEGEGINGLRIQAQAGSPLSFRCSPLPPFPISDLRQVLAVFVDVVFMVNQFVTQGLFGVRRPRPQAGHAVNHIPHHMKSVQIIEHHHVKGGGCGALFFVTPHVQIPMIGPAISQPMY